VRYAQPWDLDILPECRTCGFGVDDCPEFEANEELECAKWKPRKGEDDGEETKDRETAEAEKM
jgi:hypothetical protein